MLWLSSVLQRTVTNGYIIEAGLFHRWNFDAFAMEPVDPVALWNQNVVILPVWVWAPRRAAPPSKSVGQASGLGAEQVVWLRHPVRRVGKVPPGEHATSYEKK